MNYHVLGIGHAISDIEKAVTDEFLSHHTLAKGAMTHPSLAERNQILAALPSTSTSTPPTKQHPVEWNYTVEPGGSVANTLVALSKLGKSCCFLSGLGADAMGKDYLKAFGKLNIAFPLALHPQGESGSSLILVTPDAERTMLTTLGCSTQFTIEKKHLPLFEAAKLLYIEGYLLEAPQTTANVHTAIKMAKSTQTPIALSASNYTTVERHSTTFQELLTHIDILFANEDEIKALALTQERSFSSPPPAATDKTHAHANHSSALAAALAHPTVKATYTLGTPLNRKGLFIVATLGEKGALLWDSRASYTPVPVYIPAIPTKVIDTTGAGDAYAAGVLNGILEGHSTTDMGHQASQIAATVIARLGARY